LTGTIKTILPNGKAGFISSTDGKDYYFRLMNYNGDKKNLKVGIKVKFNIQDSFDKVKKKQSKEAANVR
jgi:cold shock CspA family protein